MEVLRFKICETIDEFVGSQICLLRIFIVKNIPALRAGERTGEFELNFPPQFHRCSAPGFSQVQNIFDGS